MLLLNKAETFEIYFPKSRQRYNLRSSRIISRASFWSFVNTSTHTVCLDGKRIVKNPLLCVRTITPRSLEVLEGKLTVLPVLKWIILRCIGSAQNYCRPSYDTALFSYYDTRTSRWILPELDEPWRNWTVTFESFGCEAYGKEVFITLSETMAD